MLNTSEEGQATRRTMKSLERIKHERGGTGDDSGRQGNQSDLYESEVAIEGGCKVGGEGARI